MFSNILCFHISIIISFHFTAKDESKSPVRTSGRISVTAPPSRKTSTANNVSTLKIVLILKENILRDYDKMIQRYNQAI